MFGGGSMITNLPLMLQGYMEISKWAKPKLDANPNAIGFSMFKDQIYKGVQYRD